MLEGMPYLYLSSFGNLLTVEYVILSKVAIFKKGHPSKNGIKYLAAYFKLKYHAEVFLFKAPFSIQSSNIFSLECI